MTAVIPNSKLRFNEINNNTTNLPITEINTNIISQHEARVDTNIWSQTISEETFTIHNLTPPQSASDHTPTASFNTSDTSLPASPNILPPDKQVLPFFPTHHVSSNIVTTVPDSLSTSVSSLIIPTDFHSHPRTISPNGGHTALSPINTTHYLTAEKLQEGLIDAAEQE